MNVIGIAEKVTAGRTSTNKDIYKITIGGQVFSGFGKPPCNQGDTIEFEYEENGQYKNVTKIIDIKNTPRELDHIGKSAQMKRRAECITCAKDIILFAEQGEELKGTKEEKIANLTKMVKLVANDLLKAIGEETLES